MGGPGPRRGVAVAAIVLLVLAYATLVQGPGWNQNAHYALVRALAAGTPVIDRTRQETGRWYPTGDVSFDRGHTFSNKAPGFAFALLPAYEVMKLFGAARPVADPSGQLWFLGLWGVVLPAALLLLVLRGVADGLEPGLGTVAAVTLGVATLMLPFATLLFSHIFSALLGFSAFAFLVCERRGPPRLGHVAAAGLLAGYAVTTEFPNAILAAILGLAVLSRPRRLWRASFYAAGAYLGLLPLLLYNQWAFKSPFHLSYQSTVGFGSTNSLFLTTPSLRRLVEVLFAPTGILSTTPVVLLGAVGVLILFRRGFRFEAVVIGATVAAFLAFEASYVTASGGSSPGPRQLLPALPYLAVALASAVRRMPLTALALAAVSAVEIGGATIAHPLRYSQGLADWYPRASQGHLSGTIFGFLSGPTLDPDHWWSSRWYDLPVFVIPILLAVALAAADRPPLPLRRGDAVRAATAVLGWLLIRHEGPSLLYRNRVGHAWAAPAVLALAAALTLTASIAPALVAKRAPSNPDLTCTDPEM